MMAAMFTSYQAVNNTYSQVIDRAKISQTGRDIIGMLTRDIRMAGFKYFDDTTKSPSNYVPILITKSSVLYRPFLITPEEGIRCPFGPSLLAIWTSLYVAKFKIICTNQFNLLYKIIG